MNEKSLGHGYKTHETKVKLKNITLLEIKRKELKKYKEKKNGENTFFFYLIYYKNFL